MRGVKTAAGVLIALGVATGAIAASYEYDALGRLTEVANDDGSTTTYTYDAAGNRTATTTINAAGDPPGPNAVVVVPLNGFTVIPLY